jgi:preprotein translocase subunit SecY
LSANPLATLGKLGDLKRRLIFLLGALIVYRIGAHIPVPRIDPLRKSRKSVCAGTARLFAVNEPISVVFLTS